MDIQRWQLPIMQDGKMKVSVMKKVLAYDLMKGCYTAPERCQPGIFQFIHVLVINTRQFMILKRAFSYWDTRLVEQYLKATLCCYC